jgi:membrane protein implicated in regulation of membrane protease activity
MVEFFAELGIWDWFIVGGLLLIMEVMAPGVFMLWLGIAAILVGAISLFVNWAWQAQLLAFAAFAAAAIPLWRRLAQRGTKQTDQPFLNRRADALIGRIFTLDRPIVDGDGRIGVYDTVWRVTGTDMPAGTRVRVTRIDGTSLHVERAES